VYAQSLKVSVAVLAVTALLFVNIDFAEAHLIGSDVITKKVENYEVRFQAFPLYPSPERPTTLGFSILDQQGNNIWNVEAGVNIQKDGSTIFTSQKIKHEISDFYIEYMFPEEGIYQVILEANIPEESKIVKADFALMIGQKTDSELTKIMLAGGSIGAVAVASFFLAMRVNRAKGKRKG
jgi:hypothetical protein